MRKRFVEGNPARPPPTRHWMPAATFRIRISCYSRSRALSTPPASMRPNVLSRFTRRSMVAIRGKRLNAAGVLGLAVEETSVKPDNLHDRPNALKFNAQSRVCGQKRGCEPLIGRAKSGMHTKLHATNNTSGRPKFFVAAAQWLLADRSYEAEWFCEALQAKWGRRLHF